MLGIAPYVIDGICLMSTLIVFGCVLYNKMQVTQVELAAVEVTHPAVAYHSMPVTMLQ